MGKSFLRKNGSAEITDYIYPVEVCHGMPLLPNKKYFISDHINLSGDNPLKGPNFISLTNTYKKQKKGLIVACLKEGIEPNAHERKILLKAGVKAYCYKLVSTVILAASRGLKVKAIGIVRKKD